MGKVAPHFVCGREGGDYRTVVPTRSESSYPCCYWVPNSESKPSTNDETDHHPWPPLSVRPLSQGQEPPEEGERNAVQDARPYPLLP